MIITDNSVLKQFIINNEQVNSDIVDLFYKHDFSDIYTELNFIYFDKEGGYQWHEALVFSKTGEEPSKNKVRDFANLGNGWFYYYGE